MKHITATAGAGRIRNYVYQSEPDHIILTVSLRLNLGSINVLNVSPATQIDALHVRLGL